MRYGIVTANLGDYADPRVGVRLARTAEAAGWEAFFVWDHLGFVRGVPSGDPWVILSAVAASTTRLKLGLAVIPLARRLQVVANALASLRYFPRRSHRAALHQLPLPAPGSRHRRPAHLGGRRERRGRRDP